MKKEKLSYLDTDEGFKFHFLHKLRRYLQMALQKMLQKGLIL